MTYRYPYKPGLKSTVLPLFLFATCCAVLTNITMTNEVGLDLRFSKFLVISMDTSQATLFYGLLALVAAVFVYISLYIIFVSRNDEREIVIGTTEFLFPQGGVRKKPSVTISYHEIESLELRKSPGGLLIVVDANGVRTTISEAMASKKKLREIFELITERVQELKVVS